MFEPSIEIKKLTSYVSLYYLLCCVILGLPMWYMTTTTYRAELPVSDILKLSTAKISIDIKLNIINFDGKIDTMDLLNFEEEFFDDIRNDSSFSKKNLNFKFRGYVRQASKDEVVVFKNSSFETLSNLENSINYTDKNGFYVILLPSNENLFSSFNTVYIKDVQKRTLIYLTVHTSLSKVRDVLRLIMRDIFLRPDLLSRKMHATRSVPARQAKTPISRDLSGHVRSASRYSLLFSLIVPRPSSSKPLWDFPTMQRIFLQSLIKSLSPHVHIDVSSQIIYGLRLESLWPSTLKKDGSRVYSREDLTHVVNGAETFLGSNGSLHFVTYLAPAGETPVRLAREHHLAESVLSRSGVDAFTVPRWGGFVVHPHNNGTIDVAAVMSVFVDQLHQLLGLEQSIDPAVLSAEQVTVQLLPSSAAIRNWALQHWLRLRTVENIVICQITLSSVTDLLDKVVNMVISDDVAASIRSATSLALASLQSLSDTGAMATETAHSQSSRAMDAAESAFFHPSLLGLLYFLEEQKYGIYIPLFIPIILPIIISISKIRANLFTKTKVD